MDRTEEGKFELQLDLKTGNEDIDLYIWKLHEYLISFETSSIKQLVISLDRLSQVICDDIDAIAEGRGIETVEDGVDDDGEPKFTTVSNLKVLSPSGFDKSFDRILNLVGKIKDFKAISELAESLRPDIAERKEEVEKSKPKKINIDLGDNPFEALQNLKLKNK